MIEIVSYPSAPPPGKLAAIFGRQGGVGPEVEQAVRDILHKVREGGDQALCALTREFDGIDAQPETLRMQATALAEAAEGLDADLRASIAAAAANIRAFHERQKLNSWFMEDGDGVILGKKIAPIERIGLCIPAGEVPLFSSLLMTAIPAQVAGVEEICVGSPPVAAGRVDPTIAATAHILGIEEVYAVGGAQAVAAQQQGFGVVGIAMLPGPSEIAVLADHSADPALVAADLLSQAEHGWGVAAVCITDREELARAVQKEVAEQLAALPRSEIMAQALDEYGAVVVVPDLDAGMDLLNRMAPEHAELLGANPWAWVDKVRHCGALFLGSASTEPVGDYFAGTNHVLPTNGAARYASSLGVADFVKTTSIIAYTDQRLATASEHIVRLAEAEGLAAHARAVSIRQDRRAR